MKVPDVKARKGTQNIQDNMERYKTSQWRLDLIEAGENWLRIQ